MSYTKVRFEAICEACDALLGGLPLREMLDGFILQHANIGNPPKVEASRLADLWRSGPGIEWRCENLTGADL